MRKLFVAINKNWQTAKFSFGATWSSKVKGEVSAWSCLIGAKGKNINFSSSAIELQHGKSCSLQLRLIGLSLYNAHGGCWCLCFDFSSIDKQAGESKRRSSIRKTLYDCWRWRFSASAIVKKASRVWQDCFRFFYGGPKRSARSLRSRRGFHSKSRLITPSLIRPWLTASLKLKLCVLLSS